MPSAIKKLMLASAAVAEAAANPGEILALPNPEGKEIIVTRVLIHVTEEPDGAVDVDLGIAADDSTLSDNLCDGVDVSTAGLYDGSVNLGDNGQTAATWGSGEFLTISKASGSSEDEIGLAFDVFVEYLVKDGTLPALGIKGGLGG